MLTAEEHAEVCKMIDEWEKQSEAGGPGSLAAWYKMKQMAETTGDVWDFLARKFLRERASHQTKASYPDTQ